MKKYHLLFLFAAFIAVTSSAQKLDNLVELKQKSENPLFHHLDKAPRTPAFECEGYWVWGSSVVKGDDGKYHMFVSLPFHPGWMVASEIVHAVSEVPQGPYRFSEVALPARGAQYWDGRSTHNPRILKQNGKYYLIYMGSTHPFADPTYEQLTLESPWCTVETPGRAYLEDQAQYFLQLSDLKPLAHYSRRRFGDDDIQGTPLHGRLPALDHEPRNGLCTRHRRALSGSEQ